MASSPMIAAPQQENPLLTQFRAPLEDLLRTQIESDISGERAFQLRTLHRNERYWRGDHYSAPTLNRSTRTIEWNTASGNQRSSSSEQDRSSYAYVLNYFYGDGSKLIGVLGRIPNAKATADRDAPELSERAEKATKIIKELWAHWKVEQLQPELVLSLWKNGTTFGYTPFVASKERYGETELQEVALREVELEPAGFECPECGSLSPPDPYAPPSCQTCGRPLGEMDFRDPQYAEVAEPTGTVERFANGSVEFHLCTPYTVTTPFYIKTVEDCPWLWYEYEEYSGTLIRAYPELRAKRLEVEARGSTSALSEEARFAREQAASPHQRHYQSYRPNYWRYARFWLTPAMFEGLETSHEELRDQLLQTYPSGAKVTSVNGHIVRMEDEKLSSVWAMCKPTVGEYAYSLALGHNYPALNDLINDGANMMAMVVEKGIPLTLYNPQYINFKRLKDHRSLPAEYVPVLPQLNGSIRDHVHQTPPAELHPATIQMMEGNLGAARDVTNLGKPLWGGEALDRQTMGEAEMKRNQALQPHNTTWNFIRGFWADCYQNAVTQYALHSSGDKLHFRGASSVMPSKEVPIGDLSDLMDGGWYVHCDEAIPMTWGQLRAQVWHIIEGGEALWRLFGLTHPSNLEAILESIGVSDIKPVGVDNVRKVARLISQLLEAAPIEIPAPLPLVGQMPLPPQLVPSIPVDEFEDDHELSAQAVREWSQTAEVFGRAGIRETNPAGYANVIAWGKAHLEIIQMQMAAAALPGEEGAEGTSAPPPEAPANALAAPPPEGSPAALPPAPSPEDLVSEEMGAPAERLM